MNKKLIIGLGNPEKTYLNTRHNIGKSFVQFLVPNKKFDIFFSKNNMNQCGIDIKKFIDYNKFTNDNILIVLDDINLPFGKIRLREKGSSGGHKGLQSIIDELGTKEVSRLRLGIGYPPENVTLENFVLTSFNNEENIQMIRFTFLAIKKIGEWLSE